MNDSQNRLGGDDGVGAGRGSIKKAAQVILARETGELELADRKTFNFLLSRVYGQLRLGESAIHRVPVSEILDFLGHSSNDRLHESLSRLGSVEILIDYIDDGVAHSSKAHYLSYDISKSKDGWVHFSFDAMLLRFLHNPKVFATLESSAVRRFKSTYGQRLYEIMALQLHKRVPVWDPSVDVFREVMAIGDSYTRFDNLRRRVIDPAVDEVNEIAPFSVDVEDVRSGQGGRVVALRFTVAPKGPRTLKGLSDAASASPNAQSRRRARDPNTRDLLDKRSDAERDPLDLRPETIQQAAETADLPDGINGFIDEWRQRMRGRRVRDPDRAFLHWLDIRLAKHDNESLALLDEDTITALVEGWEGAR
jgi:hypothetical protein